MNLLTLLLILLILGAFGGGIGGLYPAHYGYGGGVFLIGILVVLLVVGVR